MRRLLISIIVLVPALGLADAPPKGPPVKRAAPKSSWPVTFSKSAVKRVEQREQARIEHQRVLQPTAGKVLVVDRDDDP